MLIAKKSFSQVLGKYSIFEPKISTVSVTTYGIFFAQLIIIDTDSLDRAQSKVLILIILIKVLIMIRRRER